MYSSTSSSSKRLPGGPWLKTGLLACLVIVLVLGLFEVFWRCLGFRPGVKDGPDLWAYNYKKIDTNNSEQIVFIGDSRVKIDIDLDAFGEIFPGPKPVQLAISNTVPNPVLKMLADDESFVGIIISSVNHSVYRGEPEARWTRAAKQTEDLAGFSRFDYIEMSLTLLPRSLLAFLGPQVNPKQIFFNMVNRKFPEPPHLVTRPDRSIYADYSIYDGLENFKKIGLEAVNKWPRITPGQRDHNLAELESLVDKIQARGGQVVFVRFPTTGGLLEWEKENIPRDELWNVYAKSTSAVMVHYEDYPELSKYPCPDFSHLNYQDAGDFSRSLAYIIKSELN